MNIQANLFDASNDTMNHDSESVCNNDCSDGAPYPAGTPIYHSGAGLGFILSSHKPENSMMIIGGNGIEDISLMYKVAYASRFDEIDANSIDDMVNHAIALESAPCDDIEHFISNTRAAIAQKNKENDLANEKAHIERAAFQELAAQKLPANCQAVIIAQLIEDQSDSMTDYWGHSVKKTIILAASNNKRMMFNELRKAALNNDATKYLATIGPDAEHRQNYSMGGGYFLKDGARHASGWQIKKIVLGNGAQSCPMGEFSLPEQSAAIDSAAAQSNSGNNRFTIEKHFHSKKLFDFYICIISERVERAEYLHLLAEAKALGGWYSRKFGPSPAGFAFKDESAALAFTGNAPTDKSAPAANMPAIPANISNSLLSLADSMQAKIDNLNAPCLSNTPKRQKQAANRRIDAAQHERAQNILRALAECHNQKNCPAILSNVRTKKEALDLARENIDRSNSGYYDAGIQTNKPARRPNAAEYEKALAAWALLDSAIDQSKIDANNLQNRIDELSRLNIDGYFPTPSDVINIMADYIDITQGLHILEPQAGHGSIADYCKQAGALVDCCEVNGRLANILIDKGHNIIGDDFLKLPINPIYDAVMMNPPFQRGQDMEHISHAWQFLKEGGALVSIMGAGVTFKSDKKTAAFRDWIDQNGGEIVELPANSFKDSGTGVNTVMLVINK